MPGEITGGTECYGCRYNCDIPFNLKPSDAVDLLPVA
jgi:hypothetical protein